MVMDAWGEFFEPAEANLPALLQSGCRLGSEIDTDIQGY